MLRFPSWICLVSVGFVQAQTLYRLGTPPLPSNEQALRQSMYPGMETESELFTMSVSAVGVGADGMTTYVEEGAITAIGDYRSGTTVTIVSTFSLFTATLEEDASRLRFGSGGGSDLYGTCTFGADGKAACVDEIPDFTTTVVGTISGSAVPWLTLNAAVAAMTTSAPTPQQTASGSAPPPSNTVTQSGTRNSGKNVAVVVAAAIGSLILITVLLPTVFIRRRHARRYGGSARPLRSNESALDLTEENDPRAQPDPLILYDEKNQVAQTVTEHVDSDFGDVPSSSALPTAAEIALANMAEEMRIMRNQMQRLEMERGSAAAGSLDDLPPQYVGNSGLVVQLRNTSEDPVGPKQVRKLVANE